MRSRMSAIHPPNRPPPKMAVKTSTNFTSHNDPCACITSRIPPCSMMTDRAISAPTTNHQRNMRKDDIENYAGCSKRPSIAPAHPRRAKTRPFPSAAAGEKKLEAYRYFTRPVLSRSTPALPPGYVDDFSEPRTQLVAFLSIMLQIILPIQAPILNRFGNVCGLDRVGIGEIGNRACNTQDPSICAG